MLFGIISTIKVLILNSKIKNLIKQQFVVYVTVISVMPYGFNAFSWSFSSVQDFTYFQYFEQSNFKQKLVFINFYLIDAGKEFDKVVKRKWRELISCLNTVADWNSMDRVVTQTRDRAF